MRADDIIGSGRECLDSNCMIPIRMSPSSFTDPGTPVRWTFHFAGVTLSTGALGYSESAGSADEVLRAVLHTVSVESRTVFILIPDVRTTRLPNHTFHGRCVLSVSATRMARLSLPISWGWDSSRLFCCCPAPIVRRNTRVQNMRSSVMLSKFIFKANRFTNVQFSVYEELAEQNEAFDADRVGPDNQMPDT